MLNRALRLLKDCHADNNGDEAMHSSLQAEHNPKVGTTETHLKGVSTSGHKHKSQADINAS